MIKTRPTLLVVDDEIINIDILIEALGEDYTVRVDTDGAAALNSVKEALPDLILLDVMMPGMDGFEVCRRLKDDPATQKIPVVFLTSLNESMNKVMGFSVGGADYVTKPFQFAELRARVNLHLELSRRNRELQQSYDKLRELETLRDGLVHMIVHDMRSPLWVVLASLEMAAEDTLPKDAAHCIGMALGSTGTLVEMVNTLLDISKMEAGEMTLDVTAVDMNGLASETIRAVEPLQGQRRLTLTSPEEMGALAGDADLIRRIFQNLIGNALKFTNEETGAIAIRIEITADDSVRVSVADNGPGIPPECCEKVFDKFCQVAARKQGQVRSSGLGLTFCKLAVEAHGGRIGLESDVGRGTTFWFELPFAHREKDIRKRRDQ